MSTCVLKFSVKFWKNYIRSKMRLKRLVDFWSDRNFWIDNTKDNSFNFCCIVENRHHSSLFNGKWTFANFIIACFRKRPFLNHCHVMIPWESIQQKKNSKNTAILNFSWNFSLLYKHDIKINERIVRLSKNVLFFIDENLNLKH